MTRAACSVVILYNQTGDDVYEKLKGVNAGVEELGFEPEYDVAVPTALEEYEAVAAALRAEGFAAKTFNLQEDMRRLERVVKRMRPDVVFNLVEYFHDEPEFEGNVAAFLELYGIPYTGAPPFALTLCARKGQTKELLIGHGVPTPQFLLLRDAVTLPKRLGLEYPLIVKPARSDASAGVEPDSVVENPDALAARVAKTYEDYDLPILVEEFIEGRELHVAILGNDPPEVLPALEYDFSELPDEHPSIISYDAKWNPLVEAFHRVHTICPAPLSKAAWKHITDVALEAYAVTGCRDYARLDIRLAQRAKPFVLEVNPNPDLTEGVSFMESAEAAGYTFGQTLRSIVEFALERAPDDEPEGPVEPAGPVEPEISMPEAIRDAIAQRDA